MDVKKLGRRATVFQFTEIESYSTYVYLIETEKRFFLIDTFCGAGSMAPIREMLDSSCKEVIVINTHFHWDHVWGNCSFRDKTIVGHEKCRSLLAQRWEEQLEKNGRYRAGRADKTLPNLTFTDRLFFVEDGIELFSSPGHTEDSISVYDHEEKILYVGDNLEKPLIYVESPEIGGYLATLETYRKVHPRMLAAGHTLALTEADIENTIDYLKGLSEGGEPVFQSEYEKEIHAQNLRMVSHA